MYPQVVHLWATLAYPMKTSAGTCIRRSSIYGDIGIPIENARRYMHPQVVHLWATLAYPMKTPAGTRIRRSSIYGDTGIPNENTHRRMYPQVVHLWATLAYPMKTPAGARIRRSFIYGRHGLIADPNSVVFAECVDLKRSTYTTDPAAWPLAHAHWKLKPPKWPLTSNTSPIK